MWCTAKAQNYYGGGMRGEEYEPLGIHSVLVCYQYQWELGRRQEKSVIFERRERILNKGWV